MTLYSAWTPLIASIYLFVCVCVSMLNIPFPPQCIPHRTCCIWLINSSQVHQLFKTLNCSVCQSQHVNTIYCLQQLGSFHILAIKNSKTVTVTCANSASDWLWQPVGKQSHSQGSQYCVSLSITVKKSVLLVVMGRLKVRFGCSTATWRLWGSRCPAQGHISRVEGCRDFTPSCCF